MAETGLAWQGWGVWADWIFGVLYSRYSSPRGPTDLGVVKTTGAAPGNLLFLWLEDQPTKQLRQQQLESILQRGCLENFEEKEKEPPLQTYLAYLYGIYTTWSSSSSIS